MSEGDGGIEMCDAYTRVLSIPDIVFSNHVHLFLCCVVLCTKKHNDRLFRRPSISNNYLEIRIRKSNHGRIWFTLICNDLLTYSMVQSPSWEANWFAVSQEIPRISQNPKVHYCTHKLPPPVSILGQPNPLHIPTSHLLEIHPNIIHPFTPRSPQRFVATCVRISYARDTTTHYFFLFLISC